MLIINIPGCEWYDESLNSFFEIKDTELHLEHSLLSLSKWESKWNKPFLTKQDKTNEEVLDYIRCMTLTQNVDPLVYYKIPDSELIKIKDYINAPMTATTFSKEQQRGVNKEIITSELIYYWMVASQIPFECQKWHLNRLLTLIKICGIKNSTPKKYSKGEIMRRNSSLNAQRRAALHSLG